MAGASEAIIRRLVEEVINGGNTDLLTELVAADHVGHDHLGDRYGPGGVRIGVAECREAFPDLRLTIEDLFAHEDRAAWRFTLVGTHAGPFMDIPPTGRPVTASGLRIDRLAEGRLHESWVGLDVLGLLRQLGALPGLWHDRSEE
jgi:predicted ester cyclase